jgi:hypothetical protein
MWIGTCCCQKTTRLKIDKGRRQSADLAALRPDAKRILSYAVSIETITRLITHNASLRTTQCSSLQSGNLQASGIGHARSQALSGLANSKGKGKSRNVFAVSSI